MLLSILIFFPVLACLPLLLLKDNKQIRIATFAVTFLEFVLSLVLLARFDKTTAALQLVERTEWIPSVGISYFLGVDGLSLWLIVLTTFLTPVVVLASWKSINSKVKGFHISLLMLQAAMIGSFLAIDVILFYIFFEVSLIPMYFMIGIWGGLRRIYATVKFFIYTMLGSLFMLLAIIAMMFLTEQNGAMSASLLDFYKLDIPFIAGTFFSTQTVLFFAFCLAFAIKVPMFPFHTWLPDAHVEAPTPGSVILAGVMLKMGTYGFLRFAIPLFPEAASYWSWIFMLLGGVGIVYGALVAMVQPDIKKLVAYSSVSHMGYVILGLFAMNEFGITGSLYQMLNHGISTGALFLLVGMIYERTHSREINQYGGLAVSAPIFTILFMLATLSSIAVPLTNGFVGEYLILMGTFIAAKPYAFVAVIGVVLGAAYMLWMFKRVFFGPEGVIVEKYKANGLDVNLREVLVMAPLMILIFWMGIYPKHFLDFSKISLDHWVKNKSNYTLVVQKPESYSKKNIAEHK